jgi:redox-sensitive bicupin YhaK (pirin superfamily)
MGSSIISTARLGFPFATDSPFLFAVYHLDKYPAGNADMGVDAGLLRGHSIGADFGHASGWNMYHGSEGVPGFPKHPHRGFETITVTRRGIIDHTDSLGNGGRFGYGDVQWMTAGKGISHAEMFPLLSREADQNVNEMFQIWINLPRASKMAEPSFKMLWSEDLPRKQEAGSDVVLVAGALPGFATPGTPPPDSYAAAKNNADVLVVTVKLDAGARWTLPAFSAAAPDESSLSGKSIGELKALIIGAGLSHADCTEKSELLGRAKEALAKGDPSRPLHRNVYFYSGDAVTVDGKRFTSSSKIKVKPEVAIEIEAPAEAPAEVLILQGRDIGEPVVQHGPFVGNTQQDIMQAFTDYQRTGFGSWPWESECLVFPRERQRFAKYPDGTLEERPLPGPSTCPP